MFAVILLCNMTTSKLRRWLILCLTALTVLYPRIGVFAQSVRHVKTTNINYKSQYGFAAHDGFIYTVDHDQGRVHRHDLNGAPIQMYSGLKTPRNISLDPEDGTLLVADTGNHRILRLNSYLKLIQVIGSFGTGDGQLNSPYDVVVDKSGEIIVCDTGNNRIVRFSTNGRFISSFGMKGTGRKHFDSPQGVAVDNTGNVYVADCVNMRVKKFTKTGVFLAQSIIGMGKIRGVRVDLENNIHVIPPMDWSSILVLKPSLVEAYSYGTKGDGDYQFIKPISIFVAKDGQIFVSDKDAGQIKAFKVHDHSIDNSTIYNDTDEARSGSPVIAPGQKDAIKSPVQQAKPTSRLGPGDMSPTLVWREDGKLKSETYPTDTGGPFTIIFVNSKSALDQFDQLLKVLNSYHVQHYHLIYGPQLEQYGSDLFSARAATWTDGTKVGVGLSTQKELKAGSTHSLWTVDPSVDLTLFLCSGDGRIEYRKDNPIVLRTSELAEGFSRLLFIRSGVLGLWDGCSKCNGSAKISVECDRCKGTGKMQCPRCTVGLREQSGKWVPCNFCNGTGKDYCNKHSIFTASVSVKCPSCDSGVVWRPIKRSSINSRNQGKPRYEFGLASISNRFKTQSRTSIHIHN